MPDERADKPRADQLAGFLQAVADSWGPDDGLVLSPGGWSGLRRNILLAVEYLRSSDGSSDDLAKLWHAESEYQKREVGRKQAEIDRLMLEYCPEEMTPEQIEEWRERQCSVTPEQEAAIERALRASRDERPRE